MKKSIFSRAILCLVASTMLTSIQAQKKEPTTKKNQTKQEVYINTEDDASTSESIVNYKEGNHTYKFKIKGDKIIDLYVDDRKIPQDEYSKYDEALNKILLQIKKDKEQAQLDMIQANEDRKQAKLDMERAQLDKQRAEADMQQAQKDKQMAEADMRQAQKDKQMAELDRQQAMKDQQRATLDRQTAEEDRKLLNGLLSEIVSDKIVNDEDDISSITLNKNELIINGKKQSGSLHQKYKTKYLKDANGILNYRHNENKSQFNIQ